MSDVDAQFFELGNLGIAMGGTLACFLCILAGMHFVKALWS